MAIAQSPPRNDFFPFNRAELKESEPDVYELMA